MLNGFQNFLPGNLANDSLFFNLIPQQDYYLLGQKGTLLNEELRNKDMSFRRKVYDYKMAQESLTMAGKKSEITSTMI